MGLIGTLMALLFGGGRNAVRETVEVFRPNAEARDIRNSARAAAALGQFASEFAVPQLGAFDRFVNGLNRLPRPALALGTIGLFVTAMVEPVWFAARMQGIALIPEPLWWLMGAVVSFFFGARHQFKAQDFERSDAATFARAETIRKRMEQLDEQTLAAGNVAEPAEPAETPLDRNAAVVDWRRSLER